MVDYANGSETLLSQESHYVVEEKTSNSNVYDESFSYRPTGMISLLRQDKEAVHLRNSEGKEIDEGTLTKLPNALIF